MGITRSFERGGTRSRAMYSDCERYRYALTRVWDEVAPRLLYVMLNPSTATERANDPTIERCERRARALGQGAFGVVNLFAFRATRPADLFVAADPVGPENDAAIAEAAGWADGILCAWGVHGARAGRAAAVTALLRRAGKPMWHLGLTRGGEPRHPLYVGYAVPLQPWGSVAKTSGFTST